MKIGIAEKLFLSTHKQLEKKLKESLGEEKYNKLSEEEKKDNIRFLFYLVYEMGPEDYLEKLSQGKNV